MSHITFLTLWLIVIINQATRKLQLAGKIIPDFADKLLRPEIMIAIS